MIEMLVESKRLDDLQTFHDRIAHAVSETPLLIPMSGKEQPSRFDIMLCNVNQPC